MLFRSEWFRSGRKLSQTGNSIETTVAGKYSVKATSALNTSCSAVSDITQIYRYQPFTVYLRQSQDKKKLFLEAARNEEQITNVVWYFDGEIQTSLGTNREIEPTENGYYSALVTNQNGCQTKTRTIYFSVPNNDVITGEEEIRTDTFSIYPNPNAGIFTVRFSTSLTENAQVTIFDAIGRKVTQTILQKGNQDFSIDIKKEPKGIYLIRFNINDKVHTKTIVVE